MKPTLLLPLILVSIVLPTLSSCATPAAVPAQEPRPEVKPPEPLPPFIPRLAPGDGCVNLIDRQTELDLRLLNPQVSPNGVPLSGVATLALPQSKKEVDSWNRMVIAAVRVYSAELKELPVDSVLLVTDEPTPSINRLPFIFPRSPIKELTSDSAWRGRMGPYVQTLYVFAPLRLLLGKKAELSVRLAGRMSPLTLLKLPIPKQSLPKFLRAIDPATLREDENRMPEPAPVLAALARDFCLGR